MDISNTNLVKYWSDKYEHRFGIIWNKSKKLTMNDEYISESKVCANYNKT